MSLLNRFPSYDQVVSSALGVLTRFPLAWLCALLGSIFAANLVDFDQSENHELLEKLLWIAALGLPLFIAIVTLSEKRNWRASFLWLVQLGGLILLLLNFFSLPDDVFATEMNIARFLLLAVGLHALVAFVPFLGKDETTGFWQYNKSLFLRFLFAALFAAVLYVGLAIALAAADHLFGMEIKDERYMQLWCLIAGLFHPWLFLAGLPKNLEALQSRTDYPSGLKVFAQFILLPLVTLYFVILIAYETKIIVVWNWPIGWVSHLVLWYSVVGILSLLLLHPLRDLSQSTWIRKFGRYFFFGLVPLVVMLFLAIMRRITDYGITEHRYFVLVMALSLAVVVLYFIISKAKDIRIIPIILCAIAFLSAFGPWSAFAVSKSSQQGRLQQMLSESGLFMDGSLRTAANDISFESRKEMSSIVTYLNDWHGMEAFDSWFADSSLQSLDTLVGSTRDSEIATMMGFEYVSRWRASGGPGLSWHNRASGVALDIADYDHLLQFDISTDDDSLVIVDLDGALCFIELDGEQHLLCVRLGHSQADTGMQVEVPLLEYLSRLDSLGVTDNISPEQMTITMTAEKFDLAVVLSRVTLEHESDSIFIRDLRGDLLLRIH